MAAEIANIRSVLRSEDDQVVRSGRQHEIAWSLREPLMWWAPPELADDVVALSERPGAESRPCWQEAFAAASQSAFLRGEFDRSARLARRVLESSPQDPEVRSFCRLSLATVALYRAEFEQAASLYLLHDEIEPPSGLLAAGALALHYGRAAPEAGEIARRAVQAAVARGGPAEEAFARASLGEIMSESAPDAALTELQRAVALADERYSGFAFGIAALNLATLLQRQGNHQEALAWYPRLIAHWQRSGSWPQLWTTLRNLAELLAEVGDGGVALALLDAADRAPTATSVSGTAAVRVEALRARGSPPGDVRASGPAGRDGSRIESSEQAVEVALAAIARHTDRDRTPRSEEDRSRPGLVATAARVRAAPLAAIRTWARRDRHPG